MIIHWKITKRKNTFQQQLRLQISDNKIDKDIPILHDKLIVH